jgi:hypothetical protein
MMWHFLRRKLSLSELSVLIPELFEVHILTSFLFFSFIMPFKGVKDMGFQAFLAENLLCVLESLILPGFRH